MIVFLGGPDGEEQRALDLPVPSLVVAADSGLHRAEALGVRVDWVVGDLDSVDPRRLKQAEDNGTAVRRFPSDKDATDAELALGLARESVAERSDSTARPRLVVVAGVSGRFDLLLADALLLAGPATEPFDVVGHFGDATIHVVRPGRPVVLTGVVGEQVSLLPVYDAATGVRADGFRWPLVDAVLLSGTTRGVSNELLADRATISTVGGTLLVIQQGHVVHVDEDRVGPYDPTPTG